MPGGAHARRRRHGPPRAVARDRRRQQGHVGAFRSARRAIQPARAAAGEPALAPRRPRLAEPHGGQPVLARPLHGARGRRRALAAQPRHPLGRRDGLDAHARIARARRRDADRAETPIGAPRPARHAGRARGRGARALDDPVRSRVQGRARDRARQRAAQRRGRARAVVVRHVPHPARPHRRQSVVGAFAEPRDRRRAAPLESPHSIPGGVQRHGRGEHDARLRLAVPRHGPPPRAHARDDPDDPAACRARRRAGRRRARAAARARGQHDDLSRALSSRAAARRRARPLAVRRDESALGRVPDRDARRAHRAAADERGRRHPDGRSTPRHSATQRAQARGSRRARQRRHAVRYAASSSIG